MSRIPRRAAASAAALCLLAPAGAGAQAPPQPSDTDLARAAERAYMRQGPSQDLRGERARDAADRVLGTRETIAAQAPASPVQPPPLRVVVVPDGGFDLTDAAVGGVAALGLVALAGGSALVTVRRRGHAVTAREG